MKISNSPVTAPRSKKKKVRVSPKKTVAEAFTPISKKWVPEEQNLNSSQLMVNSDDEDNSASKCELANQIDRMSKQLIQQQQEYFDKNPGEILEDSIAQFDYTVFAQLGEINEDQEQEKKQMHRSFQKFCLLLIILHGRL